MNNWNYYFMLISLSEEDFNDYLSDCDTVNNDDHDDFSDL